MDPGAFIVFLAINVILLMYGGFRSGKVIQDRWREKYRRKHGYDEWTAGYWRDEISKRSVRSVLEEHIRNADVIQFSNLNGKCFDKVPNCKQESCQNHHISLRKKCKKICGDCDPIKNKSRSK